MSTKIYVKMLDPEGVPDGYIIAIENGEFILKPNIAELVSNEILTNTITFLNLVGDYFGKYTEPRTGQLLFDMTDASPGAFSIIYYQNATLDVGSQTFLLIKGDEFDPVGVNKLYIELDHDGNLTMNIINDN